MKHRERMIAATERPPMCDYSLHAVKTRPAEIADKLVTAKFAKSTTRGFAAATAPDVAVCLRPGTELVFERNVQYDNFIDLLPRRRSNWNTARFRQVQLEDEFTHHDALEFPDGQIVMLTRLCPGQQATVLQLPAERADPAQAREHDRQDRPISQPLPREATQVEEASSA
jgi:hypothetical protein